MRLLPFFLLLGLVILGPFATSAQTGEISASEEEALLRRAGIGSDANSLLSFLQERARLGANPKHFEKLVRQLGSDSFEEREAASKFLAVSGREAIPGLRRAGDDSDPEMARRARACLDIVERTRQPDLDLAAIRLLVRQRPGRAIETLLAYLATVEDDVLEQEITFSLDTLVRQKETLPDALVAALLHKSPACRRAAGCLVGRLGNAEQQARVRTLLGDADPEVRLRSAQGLLAGRDRAALPALIDLLPGTPLLLAWQAEELLRYAAGETAPSATLGAGSDLARRSCRQAWRTWLWKHGLTLDFGMLARQPRRPGLHLVLELDRPDISHLHLIGCDGRVRWSMRPPDEPGDCVLLPGDRVLLAGRRNSNILEEFDFLGRSLRQQQLPIGVRLCRRLAGGRLSLVGCSGFRELAADGNELWSHQVPDLDSPIWARRLANGRIAAVLNSGEIIEIATPERFNRPGQSKTGRGLARGFTWREKCHITPSSCRTIIS